MVPEYHETVVRAVRAVLTDVLGIAPERVNANGGAIAIGHPLGCSGIRISTTLLHEMQRRGSKYGLATMCVGVGQGASVIYENCGLLSGPSPTLPGGKGSGQSV